MKPLTELANNPDHCRRVWECVTGDNVAWDIVPHSIQVTSNGIVQITCSNREVNICERVNAFDGLMGVIIFYNPFALVSLLTELGYGPVQ